MSISTQAIFIIQIIDLWILWWEPNFTTYILKFKEKVENFFNKTLFTIIIV